MTELSVGQYTIVANFFSFTIAALGATTLFLWLNRSSVAPPYRMAITISGLVTFIALYHYWKISASWQEAYIVVDGAMQATDSAFNDAYRYVDWVLTVPLLLVELILVMRLTSSETVSKSIRLSILAVAMILLGYPGEIAEVEATRWLWWSLAMIPFLWIVYELFVGLRKSLDQQPAAARGLIKGATLLLIISWLFYPIVFIFPMLGLDGPTAETFLQVGYTIADVVSKAVFGVLIFAIALKKSKADESATA